MKIAFIGNFVTTSTETHHKKTFEKLGHTVIPFQENRTSVAEIMQEAVNADMLYYTHTHGWRVDTDEKIKWMFVELKRLNIPTVGFHLDLWLGLEREKDLHTDPYWRIEHFFTVDKYMADHLCQNTNTKGYYLPPGVVEDECILGTPNHEKYPYEIIFTGSGHYHPEHKYRGELIKWLKETYGDKFGHYGSGGLPQIRGLELNNLYATAKIVIGDTLCKNFNYGYYFSDRLVDVPARSGFMIFPYIQGVEMMFDIGRELITYKFNDFAELKEKIDFYLLNDEKREQIRLAGFKRAKESHTYTRRLQYIIDTLNLK